MTKVNNIVRVPTSIEGNFFRYWFEFLKPFHNLTDRELDVITCFVKQRFILSNDISNDDLLDKVVMSDDIKEKVRLECNMNVPHFKVILSKLRKNNIIVDGKINKRFIPNIPKDAKSFQLLLYFDFK